MNIHIKINIVYKHLRAKTTVRIDQCHMANFIWINDIVNANWCNRVPFTIHLKCFGIRFRCVNRECLYFFWPDVCMVARVLPSPPFSLRLHQKRCTINRTQSLPLELCLPTADRIFWMNPPHGKMAHACTRLTENLF